jgi:GTP-binding protein YchF
MEIGIIGLSQSGKTTVFNAVTRGHAPITASAPGAKANIGVAKVPDERLDRLDEIFKPKKKVPAEVTYIDVPGAPQGLGKGEGIGGEFLNRLQRADALLHVVRGFEDPSVVHVEGSVDPYRDIGSMDMEMAFADLAILERRQQRLENDLKRAKTQDRDAIRREQALIDKIKSELEKAVPIRSQRLEKTELAALEGFQFLTAKPLLEVLNIDETQLGDVEVQERELARHVSGEGVTSAALAGKLEADLARMSEDEEAEFRESLSAGESGLRRILRLSFDLLGMISFLTVGEDEVRAWTIPRVTRAGKAAGKIHSDIERGFIRAEVVSYDDMVACRTMVEARKRGVLRVEGKDYLVADGEIVNFLFNV